MKLPGLDIAETQYVDTPQGLFTASGVWFRTREASLNAFAGTVFEREPLVRLLTQAEVWLRSPETLTIWLLPVFLFVLAPLPAALAALVVYVGWKSLSPSLVSRVLVGVFRMLDLVLVQGLYYVITLSALAALDAFAALGVGLGGFILLRWGVLRRLAGPLVRPIWASLYAVPVPDQVLRALIIRAALKHRVSLPELDRIEQEILKNLKRK